MAIRAERARLNPPKDLERARTIQPFLEAFSRIRPKSGQPAPAVEAFRWLLEEYRVSLFAQELGTAEPISPKRLQQALQACDVGTPTT